MNRTYFVVNGKVTKENAASVKDAFDKSGATHIHFTDYTKTSAQSAVALVFNSDAFWDYGYSFSRKAGCCGINEMKQMYGNDVIGEYTTDKPVKRNTEAPNNKKIITGAEIKSVIGDCPIAQHDWVWNEHYRCYAMIGNDRNCLKPKTAKKILSMLNGTSKEKAQTEYVLYDTMDDAKEAMEKCKSVINNMYHNYETVYDWAWFCKEYGVSKTYTRGYKRYYQFKTKSGKYYTLSL